MSDFYHDITSVGITTNNVLIYMGSVWISEIIVRLAHYQTDPR